MCSKSLVSSRASTHLAGGAEDLQHGLHGLDDAVRGFIEHQRGLQRDQFLQGGLALAGLGWQEADEVEAGIGQAGGRQGSHRRRGTGQGDDLEPCGAHGVHYTGAGVGDGRGTGVRDQGHALAGLQAFDDLGGGFALIVFVGCQQLLGKAITLQQLAGIAGILAGHRVSNGQHMQAAQGDVADVSDGRGQHI